MQEKSTLAAKQKQELCSPRKYCVRYDRKSALLDIGNHLSGDVNLDGKR